VPVKKAAIVKIISSDSNFVVKGLNLIDDGFLGGITILGYIGSADKHIKKELSELYLKYLSFCSISKNV
jgi:hypothetical protein